MLNLEEMLRDELGFDDVHHSIVHQLLEHFLRLPDFFRWLVAYHQLFRGVRRWVIAEKFSEGTLRVLVAAGKGWARKVAHLQVVEM